MTPEPQNLDFRDIRSRLERLGSDITHLDEEIQNHMARVKRSVPVIRSDHDENLID